MSIFKEAKTIGELKALLNNLPDDLPVNLQQLKQMKKNKLPKATLKNPELTLNTENYSALFTARGEMHKASSKRFIKGLIDYTHAFCWKIPHDEPFTGVNASDLKEELTRKIKGVDPNGPDSLMGLITSDIKQWAQDSMKKKDVNFYVDEFSEVYDFKYSVSARLQNTAVLLEVSYI
jgi:hypothetical protein